MGDFEWTEGCMTNESDKKNRLVKSQILMEVSRQHVRSVMEFGKSAVSGGVCILYQSDSTPSSSWLRRNNQNYKQSHKTLSHCLMVHSTDSLGVWRAAEEMVRVLSVFFIGVVWLSLLI